MKVVWNTRSRRQNGPSSMNRRSTGVVVAVNNNTILVERTLLAVDYHMVSS